MAPVAVASLQPPADRQLRGAAAPLLRQLLQRWQAEQLTARQGRAGHQHDAVLLAEGAELLPGRVRFRRFEKIGDLSIGMSEQI